MKKIVMISLVGIAALSFTGCTDAPAPTHAKPVKEKYHKSELKFRNQGEMINYCRGMIAGEVNTKPMYVEMGRLEMDQGASYISGTVDRTRYTCQFDKNNNFVNVSKFAD